jgi:hypothetical protein
MIIKKKKTLIGRAVCISLNGVVKCGGAVAKEVKTLLVANSASTSAKMTIKITRTRICRS